MMRANIWSGTLRWLYRKANSPRYLAKCCLLTWTCVPRMLSLSRAQKFSIEFV